MQLGSGFHILSPGISHPPKRIPSQRRNQKLLVSVIAINLRIMQMIVDIQAVIGIMKYFGIECFIVFLNTKDSSFSIANMWSHINGI